MSKCDHASRSPCIGEIKTLHVYGEALNLCWGHANDLRCELLNNGRLRNYYLQRHKDREANRYGR